jgi:hypothetical protein
MAPADMFWGDRFGTVTDPFAHSWQIATHIEDLTPGETTARGQEAMASMAQVRPDPHEGSADAARRQRVIGGSSEGRRDRS